MSLVAYGSSDESSDEEVNSEKSDGQKKVEDETKNKSSNENGGFLNNSNAPMNLPTPQTRQSPLEKSSTSEKLESDLLGFGALPKPKTFKNEYENVPEDDDIPLFKPKLPVVAVPTKKDRVPARISIPSLSEFKDVDEDLENSKNRPTASKSGTGLFSILPPPKSEISIKKNNLIPHVLTKTAKKSEPPKTAPKVSLVKAEKPGSIKMEEKQVPRLLAAMDYDSNSEDEEEGHRDFFSLSKPVIIPEIPMPSMSSVLSVATSGKAKNQTILDDEGAELQGGYEKSKPEQTVAAAKTEHGETCTLISTVMNLPREEILLKNKAEVGPKLPVPEQEYNVDSEGNVAFDEKAIEYLCGKRGVKRKNKMIEEANIIEISGEDIKPDEREWLVKAMTEEPVQRPVSMQGAGPSSQSKKKHQITYLAHQAKAMEVELKNNWSQNRMARKQTQSKYGF